MGKRTGSAPQPQRPAARQPRGLWLNVPGDGDEPRHEGRREHGDSWQRDLSRWAHGLRDRGPLRREREDRLVGGVAAGLATRTGFDVTAVRTVFVLGCLAGGFGAAAYVVGWLMIPADGEDGIIMRRALADRRGMALAAAVWSLLSVAVLIGRALGVWWISRFGWWLVIAAVGLILIWRNASQNEQAALRRLTGPLLVWSAGGRRSRLVWRVPVALALLAGGLFEVLNRHRHAPDRIAGVLLLIAAVVVMLGPWWLRIARDLVMERQARVRAEERADMAARVHDSVLQTLALIQLRAGEPQRVIQLARAQERELRSWLFDGRAPGAVGGQDTTVAAGVRLIQQEVEAQHGVAVEAVTVGDCDLDEALSALLAAAREATVNAAKWSGADVVSLFAEVEPAQVSVFVRDRGRGFDPAAVPDDRKGLAESVRARMVRRGGAAIVRSVPGEGTEVSLTMPRAIADRRPSRA